MSVLCLQNFKSVLCLEDYFTLFQFIFGLMELCFFFKKLILHYFYLFSYLFFTYFFIIFTYLLICLLNSIMFIFYWYSRFHAKPSLDFKSSFTSRDT